MLLTPEYIFRAIEAITPEFLRLMNTPEEFIADGSTYFRLELFGMVITFFNTSTSPLSVPEEIPNGF